MPEITEQFFTQSMGGDANQFNQTSFNTPASLQDKIDELESQKITTSADGDKSGALQNQAIQSGIDSLTNQQNAQQAVNQVYQGMLGGNTGQGVAALNQLKNNTDLVRQGVAMDDRFNDYGDFMRQMNKLNPSAMSEVFPLQSGSMLKALSGPLSSVLTGNPMGIISSFIKDSLSNKSEVKEMGHGGVMSMADPAIAITINMGPGLPVNMQEIKEQKMAYNKNKMAEGMSGQRNMDAVDLAPDLTRGI